MATHDYVIANASGSSVRSDLNNALAAIVSNNSSSSEPSTKYAYMLWADTTNNLIKLRNSANNAWITLFTTAGGLDVDAASNFNGDVTFTGASANVTWDKSADDFIFNDNAKAVFGTSSDGLALYHDGTESWIKDTGTGDLNILASDLQIKTADDSAFYITAVAGGAVSLYNDGTKKFETTANGVEAGQFKATNTFSPAIVCLDNGKAEFGTGSDFKIYFDGTNSNVSHEPASGSLVLTGNTMELMSYNGSEKYFKAVKDGSVELYWNNNKKLETMDEGVNIIDNTDTAVELRLTANSATRGHVYADSNNFHGFLNNSGSWTFRLESNGDYHFYGSSGSDRDLKDNITTVTGTSLDKITKLVPKTYNWKATADGKTPTDKTFTGFIAQEVKEHLPVLVTGTDGQKDMSVDYFGILAHAVKAITELSTEVETLKTKVAALEAK